MSAKADTPSTNRPATAPPPAAPGPHRRPIGSTLLYGASGSLLLLAAFHAAGYFTASLAVKNSGLQVLFQDAFGALWLGYSLQTVVISGIVLVAAFRPGSVSRPVVVLCGLLPLVTGVLVMFALKSTVGIVLLCLAALLVVAGVLLQPRTPPAGTAP